MSPNVIIYGYIESLFLGFSEWSTDGAADGNTEGLFLLDSLVSRYKINLGTKECTELGCGYIIVLNTIFNLIDVFNLGATMFEVYVASPGFIVTLKIMQYCYWNFTVFIVFIILGVWLFLHTATHGSGGGF